MISEQEMRRVLAKFTSETMENLEKKRGAILIGENALSETSIEILDKLKEEGEAFLSRFVSIDTFGYYLEKKWWTTKRKLERKEGKRKCKERSLDPKRLPIQRCVSQEDALKIPCFPKMLSKSSRVCIQKRVVEGWSYQKIASWFGLKTAGGGHQKYFKACKEYISVVLREVSQKFLQSLSGAMKYEEAGDFMQFLVGKIYRKDETSGWLKDKWDHDGGKGTAYIPDPTWDYLLEFLLNVPEIDMRMEWLAAFSFFPDVFGDIFSDKACGALVRCFDLASYPFGAGHRSIVSANDLSTHLEATMKMLSDKKDGLPKKYRHDAMVFHRKLQRYSERYSGLVQRFLDNVHASKDHSIA